MVIECMKAPEQPYKHYWWFRHANGDEYCYWCGAKKGDT